MRTKANPDFEAAVCAGAVATVVLTLAPYLSALVFPGCIGGAAVAVWYRVSVQTRSLQFKEAAKLGMYSTFVGTVVVTIIFDVVWQIWDYQIGERQNSQLLLALIGLVANREFVELAATSLAESGRRSFEVFILFFQLVGSFFLAGVFGTASGLMACKVMKSRMPAT